MYSSAKDLHKVTDKSLNGAWINCIIGLIDDYLRPARVRPRARFCVIFHTKILKNARKSRARV